MDNKELQGLLPALLATNKNIVESDKLHTQQHIQLLNLIRKTTMTPEWSSLLLSLNDRLNAHDSLNDTMKVLIDTLGSLRDHTSDLTTIVNSSLDRDTKQQQAIEQMTNTVLTDSDKHQQSNEQILQAMNQMTHAIEHISECFIENTSRLDTLTLALQDAIRDNTLDETFQNLVNATIE